MPLLHDCVETGSRGADSPKQRSVYSFTKFISNVAAGTVMAFAFSAVCTSSSLISIPIRSALAVRVGIVGPTTGAVAGPMYAVYDGVKLAFTDMNKKGGVQGKPIEWLFTSSTAIIDGVETLTAEATVDAWMANESTRLDCLAVPPGELLSNALYAAANKHNLTVFGPTSGVRADFLEYSMTRALIAPIPDIEVASLVRYIILKRNLNRVAVMMTYGVILGNDLIPYIKSLLAEFGLELVYQFTTNNPNKTMAQQAAESVAKRPQALIQLGQIDYATVNGLIALLGVLQSSSDWLIATPAITFPILTGLFALFPPSTIAGQRLISATYSPLHDDPDFVGAIEYRRLVSENPDIVYWKSNMISGANFGMGVFAMTGFLIGTMMTSIFASLGANVINSTTIRERAFDGWLIPAYDYVFGPYSRPCFDTRKISCGCHSGSRQVHMAYFDTALEMHRLQDSIVDISLDACLPINVPIQSPLIQLVAMPTANLTTEATFVASTTAHADFIAGDIAGYVNVSTSPSSRTGILLEVNYSGYSQLATVQTNRLLTVSIGSIYASELQAALSANLTVALDPLYTVPPLHNGFVDRVVHLLPTLQQEVHALTSKYGQVSVMVAAAANGVTDTHLIAGLALACEQSANTFGNVYNGWVRSAASVASGLQSIVAAPPSALMVHGLRSAADVAAVADYLTRHSSAVLLIPFHHVSLWYDELLAAVTGTSRRSRLVFATSLPNWNPASAAVSAPSESALMQSYYAAMSEASLPYNPQTLRGFLTQRLVANIVERIPSKLTQQSFLETLYAVSVVVLDAAAYSVGPLSNAACGATSSSSATICETNVGARQVWVRSFEAAVATSFITSGVNASDSTALSAFTFASGRISYMPLPPGEGLSVIGLVLGLCGGAIAVLLVILLLSRLLSGRSHTHAPKDQSKPFTIIFTDIQSSTNLWAEVPEEMGRALEVHHAIIRKLIKKHRGYEVKTIGDAFMIAFKSADDAVKLAYDLQFAFYDCEQFPIAIDTAYLNFDREKLGGGEPVPNLSCELSDSEYAAKWSGLRVRVGINTDFGSIQKDPVTEAYDYYGTVTNTSARVEAVSHGGQVCLTEATLKELTNLQIELRDEYVPSSTASLGVALRLGKQQLRGLSNDVAIFQLECVPGRVYPPLRLDSVPDEVEDEFEGGASDIATTKGDSSKDPHASSQRASIIGDTASVHSNSTLHKAFYPNTEIQTVQVMAAIVSLFSRIPTADKRAKEMKRLCDLWGIRVDRKQIEKAQQWGKTGGYSEDAVNRMTAMQLAKEDANTAAHLEALSKRIKNIVGRNLLNAVGPFPNHHTHGGTHPNATGKDTALSVHNSQIVQPLGRYPTGNRKSLTNVEESKDDVRSFSSSKRQVVPTYGVFGPFDSQNTSANYTPIALSPNYPSNRGGGGEGKLPVADTPLSARGARGCPKPDEGETVAIGTVVVTQQ